MILWLKKAFSWIGTNSKWLLLAGASIFLAVIGICWYRNKQTIADLKNKVYILQTKMKLDKLAMKNDIMVEDLKDLKEKEASAKEELEKIEEDLKTKLSPTLTIEEIAKKFKELNL